MESRRAYADPARASVFAAARRHDPGTHHAYRSPNADMAALVVEAASGHRYAELLEDTIWKRWAYIPRSTR
ncbi:serine hydrolase [Neorhizobium sp. T6_25]|uniref:serine hydrolase n=1 Tax=Neorhizobium sp. T6_25 TaxID=2093833 RepID=UPI00352A9324